MKHLYVTVEQKEVHNTIFTKYDSFSHYFSPHIYAECYLYIYTYIAIVIKHMYIRMYTVRMYAPIFQAII